MSLTLILIFGVNLVIILLIKLLGCRLTVLCLIVVLLDFLKGLSIEERIWGELKRTPYGILDEVCFRLKLILDLSEFKRIEVLTKTPFPTNCCK